MEKFVDRIIETDRKAREIIEGAQREKAQLEKQAREEAARRLEERAAQNAQAIAGLDEQYAQSRTKAEERAEADYITAKHALDADFAAGHDAWLRDVVDACEKA